MFGRAARTVCLVVAAWALLFAPGAALEDALASGTEANDEQVAAAIVAPTFGSDALLDGRPCQMGADRGPDVCQVDAALLPASPAVLLGVLVVRRRLRKPGVQGGSPRSSWSTRAPPRA